ncbi:dihydroxyacetone kinase subunit L [candidate division KSB3 bacterium]|uniref:Dihydroxyacetone kinase subunit L n=1 Tax=candidate division KSB3 bacterium TaxID=2044937 RepID=A0A2G6KGK3_9BACT|nr:MAG: dihydroxyacetone kinase subunit L [candidate division KSB3 bacterium]
MGKSQLGVQEAQAMIIHISQKMLESKDLLTQADKAIGDGDHGIGMARGFEAVLQKIEGQEFSSIDQLFKAVGMALMMSIGGAAGAIFGTLFRGMAKNQGGTTILDARHFSQMLLDGLQAVKNRGKSKPGDKTMVDALEPAALESKNQISSPLDQALAAIAESARLGMESTKEMVATTGKAKTLGERSLGHPDPGAISMSLLLKFMHEYTAVDGMP